MNRNPVQRVGSFNALLLVQVVGAKLLELLLEFTLLFFLFFFVLLDQLFALLLFLSSLILLDYDVWWFD